METADLSHLGNVEIILAKIFAGYHRESFVIATQTLYLQGVPNGSMKQAHRGLDFRTFRPLLQQGGVLRMFRRSSRHILQGGTLSSYPAS